MVSFLDGVYIDVKNRIIKGVERFKSDEQGVAAIVATVLLILIVVLLASMFWSTIKDWMTTLWKKVTGAENIPSTAPGTFGGNS